MSLDFKYGLEYAHYLDDVDILFSNKERFSTPKINGENSIYLAGNILGLQPKSFDYLSRTASRRWAEYGMDALKVNEEGVKEYTQRIPDSLAKIMGCLPTEVAIMSSSQKAFTNLSEHFYKAKDKKSKIIIDSSIPSYDFQIIKSRIERLGLVPEENIIFLKPEENNYCFEIENILSLIEKHNEQLSFIYLNAVNLLSGQFLDIEKITKKAHHYGTLIGLNLSDAIGNVALQLHEWGLDFATFSTHKYLNAGPGATEGIFVHEKWIKNGLLDLLAGWKEESVEEYLSISNHEYDVTNSFNPFNKVGLKASLDIFEHVKFISLREKSIKLTGYLEFLLKSVESFSFQIITPSDPEQRGAQLSLFIEKGAAKVSEYLRERGVYVAQKNEHIISIAPIPLYNSFEEVYYLTEYLKEFTF